MSKINELPEIERPREKFIRYGGNALSDEELLAIIIGSGFKGRNAKDVAYDILSSCGGLTNFSKLTLKSFSSHKGISNSRALTLCAMIELWKRISIKSIEVKSELPNVQYLCEKYKTYLNDMYQEHIIVICLNRFSQIVHEEIVSKGSNNKVYVCIKDILRVLLVANCSSFYLIHNHPSGLSSPSNEDILFTQNLIIQSHNLFIKMIDHLIVAKDGSYSFKNRKAKIV